MITAPKVIDSSLLARNHTVICIDPDVLFFGYPAEIFTAVTVLLIVHKGLLLLTGIPTRITVMVVIAWIRRRSKKNSELDCPTISALV